MKLAARPTRSRTSSRSKSSSRRRLSPPTARRRPTRRQTLRAAGRRRAGFRRPARRASSTALVGLGEGARYSSSIRTAAPSSAPRARSRCCWPPTSAMRSSCRASTRSDLRAARRRATLKELEKYQCADGGFAYWPGECQTVSPYLTSYVLHVYQTRQTLKYTVDAGMMRARLQLPRKRARARRSRRTRLVAGVHRLAGVRGEGARRGRPQPGLQHQPPLRLPRPHAGVRLAYLLDALVAKGEHGARLAELRRRITTRSCPRPARAHVEELTDPYLLWFWNSNVRSTPIVLGTLVRAELTTTDVNRMVRWLMRRARTAAGATRRRTRWRWRRSSITTASTRAEMPDFTGVGRGSAPRISCAQTFKGRRPTATMHDVPMATARAKAAGAARLCRPSRGRRHAVLRDAPDLRPDAATLTARRQRLQHRAPVPRADATARPARSLRRSRPAISSASRWRSICRRSAATSRSPIRFPPASSRWSRGSRRRPPTSRAAQRRRGRRVEAELAGRVAPRRLRPRRAPRRPRAALRDAARRRPPRVLLRRPRDDRRHVPDRAGTRRRDVRAGGFGRTATQNSRSSGEPGAVSATAVRARGAGHAAGPAGLGAGRSASRRAARPTRSESTVVVGRDGELLYEARAGDGSRASWLRGRRTAGAAGRRDDRGRDRRFFGIPASIRSPSLRAAARNVRAPRVVEGDRRSRSRSRSCCWRAAAASGRAD